MQTEAFRRPQAAPRWENEERWELLGKAKWAELSTSVLTRVYQVFILRFCMKFHVEGKECLLTMFSNHQRMHYKSDSLVERSQPQERNKYPQKHLLNAPDTTWILGKESPLQNHPSHVAITGSNTCVGRCCGTLVVFNLSQDLGACDNHFLTSFSKSHFLLAQGFLILFVPWFILQSGEVFGSLLGITVFSM